MSGAVLYVADLGAMAAFYEAVTPLAFARGDGDYVALEAASFQLVLQRTPAAIAEASGAQARRRSETPVKLVFAVATIADAREAARRAGGALDAPSSEWLFGEECVCDGTDPEGNVFQVRSGPRRPNGA